MRYMCIKYIFQVHIKAKVDHIGACPRQKSAGIEQLMPWSDFIKEKCSGVTDTSTEKPENRGNL